MDQLQVFVNNKLGEIRAIVKDGNPWFVAKDVADILGYSDTEAMIRRLSDKEKSTCTDNSSGQVRHIIIINEPGLYRAIFGSQKQEAEIFQDWVYAEVLPQIRKTGFFSPYTNGYMMEAAQKSYIHLEKKVDELSTELDNFFKDCTDKNTQNLISFHNIVYSIYGQERWQVRELVRLAVKNNDHMLHDIMRITKCSFREIYNQSEILKKLLADIVGQGGGRINPRILCSWVEANADRILFKHTIVKDGYKKNISCWRILSKK